MDVKIVFNQMIVLFLLMLIGYYSLKKDIIDENTSKKLSSIIVNITNPAFIISGVLSETKIGSINDVILVFIVAIFMYIGLVLISLVLPKILRVKKKEDGIYKAMTVFSNVGFIGFPIISALFGKEVLLYGAIFILPYNILAYSYGIYVLTKDNDNEKVKLSFKNFVNLGIISCLVAVVIFIFNIKLPSFAIKTVDSLANLTTPLSMMVIGVSIGKLSFKELFTDVKLYVFSAIKLVIIPIFAFFILKYFVNDEVIIGTTIIMLCTPIGSMTAMLATEYGGDDKLASKGVLLTTIISIITMPLVIFLLF